MVARNCSCVSLVSGHAKPKLVRMPCCSSTCLTPSSLSTSISPPPFSLSDSAVALGRWDSTISYSSCNAMLNSENWFNYLPDYS